MFNKNLTFYRLRKQMSKKELAEIVNVTPMAITNYENGSRQPNMEILRALASALGVRVSDFLISRNTNLVFEHGEFRKNSSLTKGQQEYIRESTEEYFSRFMTVIEMLGGDVLPSFPKCYSIDLDDDDEINASKLRKHLGFAVDGPLSDLIGKMENKGILVYLLDIDNSRFSGRNGLINGRPYIVLNSNMNAERIRSTLSHELAHLMFKWPETMLESEIELKATSISGAFLFPKCDAVRELGLIRKYVSKDMVNVAIEYGISMMLLVKRSEICGIITQNVAKKFYIEASKLGWRSNEPSRIVAESATLFNQLVFRAVNEKEISFQKGAELLKIPYDQVVKNCCFDNEV